MRIRFYPSSLSEGDRETMSLILELELGIQAWNARVFSYWLREEVTIHTQ